MPYAAVNGLNMYYEEHGEGPPLLLLHGGSGSIPEKWIPDFSPRFHVIAMEQMGHGRTADLRDRPFHYHDMAEDTVELMRQLGIESASVLGYSDGGIIGLDMAIHHPERVTKLAVTGANCRTDGYTAENLELVRSFDPDAEPVSDAYARLSPDGADHWPNPPQTSEADVDGGTKLHARATAEHQGAHPDHRRRRRHRHAGARHRDVQNDPRYTAVRGSALRSRRHAEEDDPDVPAGSSHRREVAGSLHTLCASAPVIRLDQGLLSAERVWALIVSSRWARATLDAARLK